MSCQSQIIQESSILARVSIEVLARKEHNARDGTRDRNREKEHVCTYARKRERAIAELNDERETVHVSNVKYVYVL